MLTESPLADELEQALLRIEDEALRHYALALLCRLLGRREEALLELFAALDVAPDDPAVLYQLGDCWRALRRYREAAEAYGRSALAGGPWSGGADFNMYFCLHQMGEEGRELLRARPDLQALVPELTRWVLEGRLPPTGG